MSKKISLIAISIIIFISLVISIYIPNRKKIEETEDVSINYSVIQDGEKFGVVKNGEVIIEPQYDEIIITNPHREVFCCKKEENKMFVNSENKEIFKEYEKDILTYMKDNKYGLLGITGETVTEAKYEEIYNLGCKQGEVIVKEAGKYGVIDEKGNKKIENKYDLIKSDEYYSKDYGYKKSGYIVQQTTENGYRYGYYDSEGTQVLKEEYNQLSRITQIDSNDIYLIAAQNGQYGLFINNSKIIDTQYQQIEYNSDLQIFIVERTGKFGVMNLNGAEILKPEYTEIQINGIYLYTIKDEEKKVWDNTGKEVDISFETVIQKTDSKYFIKNESGNYSILDSDLTSISKQNYKYLEYIYNDCFIATNEEDKTGIIDLQEKVIIDFKYDVIQLIKGNNAVQAIDFATNLITFFDNDFEMIIEILNAEIEYLENGFKIYNFENKEGILLDNNGKLIENEV